jgi:hypothetical protein
MSMIYSRRSKSVCIKIVVISPDPLACTPTALAMKTPENTRGP